MLDIIKINEEIIAERKDLTDNEKEFARQVVIAKGENAEKAQAEIDPILKKYAQITAEKIVELYNRYIKGAENNAYHSPDPVIEIKQHGKAE